VGNILNFITIQYGDDDDDDDDDDVIIINTNQNEFTKKTADDIRGIPATKQFHFYSFLLRADIHIDIYNSIQKAQNHSSVFCILRAENFDFYCIKMTTDCTLSAICLNPP
jgi:adenosine/AMP kinase